MNRRPRATCLIFCIVVAGGALSVPALAREALGVFGAWGAFRDAGAARRCFAIAEPVARGGGGTRPFAAIGFWPGQGVRGQLHVHLSHRKARGTPVTLSTGTRRFALIAGGSDAWAPSARIDAAIVAALRAATSLSIEGTAHTGRPFADAYPLRGAATAIDAAALGCAGR